MGELVNLTEEWRDRLRSSWDRSVVGAVDFCYVNVGDSIATGVIGIAGKTEHYAAVAARLVAERLGVPAQRGVVTPDDQRGDPALEVGGHGWRTGTGGLYGGGCYLLEGDDAVLEVPARPLSRAVRIAYRGELEHSADRGRSWWPAEVERGDAVARSEVPVSGGPVWFRGRGQIFWLQDLPARRGISWYTSGIGATRTGDLRRALAADRDTGHRAYGALAPDLVTVEIGVNDTIHADEEDPGRSADALRQVVAGLRAHGAPNVALIGAVPVRATHQPGPWGVAEAYREIYRPVAREFGIPLLECSTRWSGYEQAFARGLLADQVHPSALGHADLGAGVAELVLEAVG